MCDQDTCFGILNGLVQDDDGISYYNLNVFLGSSGINLLYQIVRYDKLAVKDGK